MTYGNEINAVNHLMDTYCENVTEVFDIFQDENNVYIIMELCDMDLEQDLSNNHTRME
jgi:serine/threonine protein kinase